MSDQEKSKEYEGARAAFDALGMEERAAFLVESVVAMLAEGVGEAGRVVSEVVDEMARAMDGCCADDEAAPSDAEAGAAGAQDAKKATVRKPRAKPGRSKPASA